MIGPIALVLLLNAGLFAAVVAAHAYRSGAARRTAAARTRVRHRLAALARQPHDAATLDLEWWLAHAEAVSAELTAPLAARPSLGGTLEAVSTAAANEVLRLLEGAQAGPMTRISGVRRRRLRRAARLVCLAPTRPARRALLALQAGTDDGLGVLASAALAGHAATFTDTSPALAFFLSRAPSGPRALAARWALARLIDADRRRAAVHLQDDDALVRSVALSGLDAAGLASQSPPDREAAVSRALACTSDADARVRAAAFEALTRVAPVVPETEVDRGLHDPVERVRSAAARAIPFAGGDAFGLLRVLDKADAGLGRLARLQLRTHAVAAPEAPPARAASAHRAAFFQRLAAVPSPDAEPAATEALTDADPVVRREAALALAALARTRRAPGLQPAAIDALLARLPSESSAVVVRAFVEALEASADARVADQLTAHASRAGLGWRLRLTEAAALVRHVRAHADRRSAPRSSGDIAGSAS